MSRTRPVVTTRSPQTCPRTFSPKWWSGRRAIVGGASA